MEDYLLKGPVPIQGVCDISSADLFDMLEQQSRLAVASLPDGHFAFLKQKKTSHYLWMGGGVFSVVCVLVEFWGQTKYEKSMKKKN